MSKPKAKLRFAPSPNGHMHLGHAYSALLNVQIAKALDGEFIIRMEDIDQARCTDEYQQVCLNDLAAIGVTSDAEIMYQSERQFAYEAALEKLTAMGVIYPCLATRGDIRKYYDDHPKCYDPDGGLVYPHLYKNLSLTEQQEILNGEADFALRLDMVAAVEKIKKMNGNLDFCEIDLQQNCVTAVEFDPMVWGDVVLARKDIATSYHLSVVVDDAAQGITHIVRGMDLYHTTYIHRVLQILLGLAAPVYYHHDLVMDDELSKLAKSHNSQAMRDMDLSEENAGLIVDLLKADNMRNLVNKIVVIIREKK